MLELHFKISLLFNCREEVQKKYKNYEKKFLLYVLGPSPRPREQQYIEIKFQQPSTNDDICAIYEKLLKLNFNVILFSKSGEKVLKSIKITCTLDLRV